MIVVIDGPDGVGKTKIAEMVAGSFTTSMVVRFPGAVQSKTCEMLRTAFLSGNVSKQAQYWMIWADFYQAFDEVVRPNIGKGKIILLDRFVTSTYVYQGMLNEKGPYIDKLFSDMMEFFRRFESCMPKYVFEIRCDKAVAVKRLKDRGELKGFDFVVAKRFSEVSLMYSIAFRDVCRIMEDYGWNRDGYALIDNSATIEKPVSQIISFILNKVE